MLVSPAEGQTARLSQFSVHVPICLSFIHFLTILVWFIPGTMMDMAWGLICEGRNVPFFVLGDWETILEMDSWSMPHYMRVPLYTNMPFMHPITKAVLENK